MSKKKSKTHSKRKNNETSGMTAKTQVQEKQEGSKNPSRLFTILGLAVCVAALWITFANLHTAPVMLKTPEAAVQTVKTLMDDLCVGNYKEAQGLLYGNPELCVDHQPESTVGKLIYPLYQNSLSYEIPHAPCVADSGLAMCVTVTSLDASSLAQELAEKVSQLPPEEAALPESWEAALVEIPADAYPKATHTITVNLAYAQDQWWVLPEEPLINIISGAVE